jgi:hypothetical protein
MIIKWLPPTAPRFCLPAEGIQTEQAELVVAKYLRDNPSQLHESARVSIFVALATVFPCQQ